MKAEKVRKAENTCMERYGATSFMASEKGLAAKREWCRRNGVENAFQLESVKEKSKRTKAERLGREHSMQSEAVRRKASANYARKTGYPHQFKDPAVVEKAKLTKESRDESGEGSRSARSAANRAARYDAFLRNPNVEPLFPRETFTALDAKSQYEAELRWRCRKCGLEFEARLDQNFSSREGAPVRCPACRPFAREGSSGAERELAEFTRKECDADVVENDRTVIPPHELDIYIPDRRIAIEFDGLFWHSDQAGKPKDYHLRKTEACAKIGIRLVHVFEDEWLSKR
jgi:rubrerythrin